MASTGLVPPSMGDVLSKHSQVVSRRFPYLRSGSQYAGIEKEGSCIPVGEQCLGIKTD